MEIGTRVKLVQNPLEIPYELQVPISAKPEIPPIFFMG